MQCRTGQKLAADGTEDRCFHEYFGTGVTVAINTWSLLTENDLLSENTVKCHLLWAMYFLKCYPRTEEGCSEAASENGAMDPKAWRKHIWPVIYALSDLESSVVSLCIDFLPSKYSSDMSCFSRLFLKTGN